MSKKTKIIRKAVYKNVDRNSREYKRLESGQIVADLHRSVYQGLKKECKYMTRKEIIQYLNRKEQTNG